ncbi:hypothetical protein HNP86_001941 [Methanococcus maripaludis]|uniref:Uncharacterized protein n=1 Tax=Methanococcus maripaludis TaxID=39152 RepID=A0A7J9NVR9_METMI|nr:hypothetical protein [Methanococcus maripaludis]MBA2851782.1 hypothetical protein [Methanococcus maripaludis]
MEKLTLPVYMIHGTLLKSGTHTDMRGNTHTLDLPKQNIKLSNQNMITMEAEHGGRYAGQFTEFIPKGDDLDFTAMLFGSDVYEAYKANPHVSAEVTVYGNELIITGGVLTKYPAIQGCDIKSVIAFSSRKQDIHNKLKETFGDALQDDVVESLVNIFDEYVEQLKLSDKVEQNEKTPQIDEATMGAIVDAVTAKIKADTPAEAEFSDAQAAKIAEIFDGKFSTLEVPSVDSIVEAVSGKFSAPEINYEQVAEAVAGKIQVPVPEVNYEELTDAVTLKLSERQATEDETKRQEAEAKVLELSDKMQKMQFSSEKAGLLSDIKKHQKEFDETILEGLDEPAQVATLKAISLAFSKSGIIPESGELVISTDAGAQKAEMLDKLMKAY